MVSNAEELGISLDSALVAEVNNFTSRLISERNLRKRKGLYNDTIQ